MIENFGDLSLDSEYLSHWKKVQTGCNAVQVVDYIKFLNGASEVKSQKKSLLGKINLGKKLSNYAKEFDLIVDRDIEML